MLEPKFEEKHQDEENLLIDPPKRASRIQILSKQNLTREDLDGLLVTLAPGSEPG